MNTTAPGGRKGKGKPEQRWTQDIKDTSSIKMPEAG